MTMMNGAALQGSAIGGPQMAQIPIPTPGQIVELTDAHERYRQALVLRMEEDWELLILTPFDAGEG